MRFSQIRGEPVVSIKNAGKQGTIEDLLLDFNAQRVAGIKVNMSGLFAGHTDLPWDRIQCVGQDAVTIQNAHDLQHPKQSPQLDNLPTATQITGDKVMDTNGNEIGSLGDIEFDPGSGQITGYVLSQGLLGHLQGNAQVIPPQALQSVGKNMMVISQ